MPMRQMSANIMRGDLNTFAEFVLLFAGRFGSGFAIDISVLSHENISILNFIENTTMAINMQPRTGGTIIIKASMNNVIELSCAIRHNPLLTVI